MKQMPGTAFQSTFYPLSIADANHKKNSLANFKIVKKLIDLSTTFIQTNKISNDPQYWNESWFGNYE